MSSKIWISGGTDLGSVCNYSTINSKQYGKILRGLNFDLEIRTVIVFFTRFSVVNLLTAEILTDKSRAREGGDESDS